MSLSLFRKTKGKDFKFIDKIAQQQFQIGGTLIYVHKYLGPTFQGNTGDDTQPINPELSELNIQDLLFVENRDRHYDKDIIELKGHYNVSDLEFNMSQFGSMFAFDSLFITFHLNEMVERLGRKLMAGDVLELIHRRDDLLLDENKSAINSFYVVKDAARSAEGYSATWYSHIWRTKVEPLKDSQEYKDIMDLEDEEGNRLQDMISTFNKTTEINDAILSQTDKEVPSRNFDSSQFFINTQGTLPTSNLIEWVFNGDNKAPNSDDIVASGRFFPDSPSDGDYFLRTDYKPQRLYQRTEGRWKHIEDNWRTKYQSAHKAYADYLEDKTITTISDYPEDQFFERQPLNDALTDKMITKDNSIDEVEDLGEEE